MATYYAEQMELELIKYHFYLIGMFFRMVSIHMVTQQFKNSFRSSFTNPRK